MPTISKKDAKYIVDVVENLQKGVTFNFAVSELIREILGMPPGIPQDTLDARETGPENSREEVTGRGTKHHTDATGHTGGHIMRVAPVRIEMSAIEGS